MFKNGYYKNEGLSFTEDLGVIFLCVPNLVIGEFFFFFLILIKVLKVLQENVWVVSLYAYFTVLI